MLVVATIALKLIIPMPQKQPEGTIKVPCPTSHVYLSLEDPLFDENDLGTTIYRACASAGDPR